MNKQRKGGVGWFHYYSTQPTSANPISAYYQFADIGRATAIVAWGRYHHFNHCPPSIAQTTQAIRGIRLDHRDDDR